MFYESIRQFHHILGNLDAIMAKAEAHAQAVGFSPDNWVGMRLAPDMLPFAYQIRIACDSSKGAAANLSGQVAPKHADDETTFAQLRERIAKVRAYLDTFKPEDFAGTPNDKVVPIPYPPGKFMHAQAYLVQRQIPQVYFHVVTAYDILRSGGVQIGKADYLGSLPFVDG